MVRKFKVAPIFFGLTISIFTAFNTYAGVDGWKLENNKWKYYKEDKALKAWQQINNNWYFFNEDGSLKTGWYLDTYNNWYFLDSSKTANEGVLLSRLHSERCMQILSSKGTESMLQADG